MNISFRKQRGRPSLGIDFFWMLTIQADPPVTLTDHFIPELFFDFFYIKTGEVHCADEAAATPFRLPVQTLKLLYVRPFTLTFSTPLVLLGARLSLKFMEAYWGEVRANTFLPVTWLPPGVDDLAGFSAHLATHIDTHRRRRLPYPLLHASLEETDWLASYSPRHKRRLYRAAFGLSRQEMQNIHNVHAFLAQTCDFAAQDPRIIEHVNPDLFYDQPHLNHTFKKMTGFSPLAYFEASSLLQDNLMAASYNAFSAEDASM